MSLNEAIRELRQDIREGRKAAMILVVDDTIEVAQLLVEVCTTTGYYADFALHGEAALYKMERIYYSLAFIDIILPGLDGNQIARASQSIARTTLQDTTCCDDWGFRGHC
jgi:CheY-like chemotaxis protein